MTAAIRDLPDGLLQHLGLSGHWRQALGRAAPRRIAANRGGPPKKPGPTSPGDPLPKNATHTFDPQRPDDVCKGYGGFMIIKLPFETVARRSPHRALRSVGCCLLLRGPDCPVCAPPIDQGQAPPYPHTDRQFGESKVVSANRTRCSI